MNSIRVLRGKNFYRLETELKDEYNEVLANFLYENNVPENQLKKLDITLSLNVDEVFEFQAKEFNLKLKVQENKMVLLFETNLDSGEFYDLIKGYFE